MMGISDRQEKFITDLLAKKDWAAEPRESYRSRIALINDRGTGHLTGGRNGTGSKVISYLLSCPDRKPEPVISPDVQAVVDHVHRNDSMFAPKSELITVHNGWVKLGSTPVAVESAKMDENKPAEVGLYVVDGAVIKVKKTRNDRNFAVEIGNMDRGYHKPIPRKGLVYRITADQRMTEDQAKAYGDKFGVCCNCGKGLSNPESVRLGIGPKCRKGLRGF